MCKKFQWLTNVTDKDTELKQSGMTLLRAVWKEGQDDKWSEQISTDINVRNRAKHADSTYEESNW